MHFFSFFSLFICAREYFFVSLHAFLTNVAMRKSILLLTALVSLVLFGCKEAPYINAPGDNSHNLDSIPSAPKPQPTADPEGIDIPEGCLNVYEARELCEKLESGATTGQKYYVKGWICRLDDKNADGITSYGNATFYMAATNDGRSDHLSFEAYQVYGKDAKKLTSVEQVQVGDFVIIYGELTKYKDTYETVGKGAAYIYASTNPNFGQGVNPTKITPDPKGADVPKGCLTVYEAIHVCDSIGAGQTTSKEYYVKGWVCRLDSKHESGVQQFGNGTFYIAATNDGTTDGFSFEAYQVYGKNKQKLTSADQVKVGDFVVIYGKLTNYNGTAETVGKGAAYIYYSTNPKW